MRNLSVNCKIHNMSATCGAISISTCTGADGKKKVVKDGHVKQPMNLGDIC